EWRSEPSDVVGRILREPDAAVGARRDAVGVGVRSRDRILGDGAFCRDAPDLTAVELNKPESAVRTRRDALGLRAGVGGKGELILGDRAPVRDTPDLVGA